MGGDEFAILYDCGSDNAALVSLAQVLIQEIAEPYDIDGRQVIVGTSLGIAIAPTDGSTPAELIKKADMALYAAKADGRGTFRFFEADMDAEAQLRRTMTAELRQALAQREFVLHYQPIVRIDGDDIVGFEALLRWQHPTRGLLPPSAFISLAEESGLIHPIGEWAIREACSVATTWPSTMRLAVNLSPAQFRSAGLALVVARTLAASGLHPGRLELEINETALWEDIEASLEILYCLRGLGVRIAMDDFGTGHSSLAYLQSFPFDRIKIDRSFVKDIADRSSSKQIVRALAEIAQALGMETTVEGIERQDQLEAVKLEGCTEMQGFLFSRAVPADELRLFFERTALSADDAA
jgi:predicted signal transduction protein with EAL and GGDEF domain